MKKLRQITVVGLGLLGGSISLSAFRTLTSVKVVGYSHRPQTREKARNAGIAHEVFDDISQAVENADLVILATPISTFENIFKMIAPALPAGCIVTDVGSTKVSAHRWAQKELPGNVYYVGSHPIAGSEQRGIEFARDDLLQGAHCVLTTTKKTNANAVKVLADFWEKLGCNVSIMTPVRHDSVLASISHLPHIMAVALVNASKPGDLNLAGKGFLDTSRVASGPANIWQDILLTNAKNNAKNIDRIIVELEKIQNAIKCKDDKKLKILLEKAAAKRAGLIEKKIKRKEMES